MSSLKDVVEDHTLRIMMVANRHISPPGHYIEKAAAPLVEALQTKGLTLVEKELHYFRSVLETMKAFRAYVNTFDGGFSLGDMVLADNIDFLDCFIDKHTPKG